MASHDITIGCLLIASWANMILFTLQGVQTYRYFARYPKDTWFNKISVLGALASDFMTVFACLSVNYLYLVTHWGNETYIKSQPRVFPVYIIGTGVTATIVQIWLTRMVFNLTKQWMWPPLIALFILTGLAGAGATAFHIFIDPSYTGRDAVVRYVTIWLSGSAAADVIITGLLVWTFRTLKTNFVNTTELLRRLSITSVRNGSITTMMTFVPSVLLGLHTHHLISLVNLVVFKLQPETNSAVMIEASPSPLHAIHVLLDNSWSQMTIGRIYTLSMLANLNNRTLLAGQLQASVEMHSTIKFNSTGLHPPEQIFESDGSMNSGLHNSYLGSTTLLPHASGAYRGTLLQLIFSPCGLACQSPGTPPSERLHTTRTPGLWAEHVQNLRERAYIPMQRYPAHVYRSRAGLPSSLPHFNTRRGPQYCTGLSRPLKLRTHQLFRSAPSSDASAQTRGSQPLPASSPYQRVLLAIRGTGVESGKQRVVRLFPQNEDPDPHLLSTRRPRLHKLIPNDMRAAVDDHCGLSCVRRAPSTAFRVAVTCGGSGGGRPVGLVSRAQIDCRIVRIRVVPTSSPRAEVPSNVRWSPAPEGFKSATCAIYTALSIRLTTEFQSAKGESHELLAGGPSQTCLYCRLTHAPSLEIAHFSPSWIGHGRAAGIRSASAQISSTVSYSSRGNATSCDEEVGGRHEEMGRVCGLCILSRAARARVHPQDRYIYILPTCVPAFASSPLRLPVAAVRDLSLSLAVSSRITGLAVSGAPTGQLQERGIGVLPPRVIIHPIGEEIGDLGRRALSLPARVDSLFVLFTHHLFNLA
ncbi:hypothetical protein B0H13DRAFT_2537526 [Mycena leptocephala]|nr:hypothetical protein B0H13DRAFT_2537526 [Mycena leptocephala]